MGAFYGFGDAAAVPAVPNGMWLIVYAFCAGTIAGGIIAMGMILIRGQYRKNMNNVKEIVGDLLSSSSIGDIADKANRRRPRWHRLPYGVPLCIGFIGYLIYWNGGL
jgi:prepilin peptidase CpaA